MLNHKINLSHDSHAAKPLWTQEESIAFECAKEVMNDMISICSSLLAKEKQKRPANLTRIRDLDQKRLQLIEERDAIGWNDNQKIARIRVEYGAKIRTYRQDGAYPV